MTDIFATSGRYQFMLHDHVFFLIVHSYPIPAACTDISSCDTCTNPDLQCSACSEGEVMSSDNKQCLSKSTYNIIIQLLNGYSSTVDW